MALGTNATRILRMIMTRARGNSSGLILGDGSITVLLRTAGGDTLQDFLSHVNALDPLTYTAGAALTTFPAASCFVPALCATRANTMEALRTESSLRCPLLDWQPIEKDLTHEDSRWIQQGFAFFGIQRRAADHF
jgi:hypothetical protein